MKQYRLLIVIMAFTLSSALKAQGKMELTVSGVTLSVALEANPATKALLCHLQQGNVVVQTSRYGGFEQVGTLPWSLPTSNSQLTTSPGDVILYNGNQLVVFFGRNSWSYTRLGRIENVSQEQLERLLNVPSCTFTLSVPQTTRLNGVSEASNPDQHKTYDLQGRQVEASKKGLYIVNGKKTLFK